MKITSYVFGYPAIQGISRITMNKSYDIVCYCTSLNFIYMNYII